MLGVGRSIGDEPFMISQIVRFAIGGVASIHLARARSGRAFRRGAARLERIILDEVAQPLLLHGVKGERAMLTELIRRLGAGEIPISA